MICLVHWSQAMDRLLLMVWLVAFPWDATFFYP